MEKILFFYVVISGVWFLVYMYIYLIREYDEVVEIAADVAHVRTEGFVKLLAVVASLSAAIVWPFWVIKYLFRKGAK